MPIIEPTRTVKSIYEGKMIIARDKERIAYAGEIESITKYNTATGEMLCTVEGKTLWMTAYEIIKAEQEYNAVKEKQNGS